MGVVYKAQDERLRRVVALKVIREFDSDSTCRQRFWHEARTESLAACEELRKGKFRDPEGIYYLARELSFLGEHEFALETLSKAINRGFFCYPAIVRDPCSIPSARAVNSPLSCNKPTCFNARPRLPSPPAAEKPSSASAPTPIRARAEKK